ncbi:MAG: hypothetical protein WBI99_05155 [Limnochordia bacterium]|nr:hypothetical protein [Limnochordia bacterium]MDI9464078.1 hypothetical protein [Bacillota bacterium]NLO94891.1 hypothetical protein [Bacillota bacterium]HOB40873.1 hypothetical protein [Limnochordia bacterium]HOK31604.1 hypothetical protein [Limnochordia bacterium]
MLPVTITMLEAYTKGRRPESSLQIRVKRPSKRRLPLGSKRWSEELRRQWIEPEFTT